MLLNEVRHMVALRGGRLHLLTGRTGEHGARRSACTTWSPTSPNATCTSAACPPAMTRAVLAGLRDLRVPVRQVHAEPFGLA